MTFFDDIQFLRAGVVPGCTAVVDQRFPGIYSLEFLLSGRMYSGIDGGERIVISEPAAFWHHPDHTYQYGAVDAEGWYHHWLLMKGPRARRFVEQGLMPLSSAGHLGVRRSQEFAGLFRELVSRIRADDGREAGVRVVLLERLLCMLMEDSRGIGEGDPHAEQLACLADAIRLYPERQYDFRDEARKMGLSYSRFRRIFRLRFGRAPYDHLLSSRMQDAARMLENPSLQVKQVASACGYEDAAQFSKLFRKKVGLSPARFRAAVPDVGKQDAGRRPSVAEPNAQTISA